ncbi:hypothetical protein MesoLjLa_65160 (plasmid) [Mesorhizobium sp. L-2-11]|nr:hypothetical protein MesoLjLa_65160 [Mesorhizobium sp. L-2-11]
MHHVLESREYKLLLEFSHFDANPTLELANSFWDQRIKPTIEGRLGKRGRNSRAEEWFATAEVKSVRFWDTSACLLTRCNYALRERVSNRKEGSRKQQREITLKLRMPDMFVVAATSLRGAQGAKIAFEEDIAPLEVADQSYPTSKVAISTPRSIRSRFSLSISIKGVASEPSTLSYAAALFPTLLTNLEARGALASRSNQLQHGPAIQEHVFKGAKVRLASGTTGEFALTIWHFAPPEPVRGVAEISFKCGFENGTMPGAAAQRAFDLFIGLQEDLGNGLDLQHPSKTELALPLGCRGE